ncbi:MAG: CBS domain-containing protein [Burkholderiaceae bacterium]|jgi:CBS domain-containing protein|nr:CBS domain-containing protein [Burkholderiaceae bacterium]
MQARDVMSTPVISVAEDASVADVARLLLRHGISAVPVLGADGRLLGIVSEGDLVRRVESGTEREPSWWLRLFGDTEERVRDYAKTHGRRATDVMTREVTTVDEDASLSEIAALLERGRIKRVPVMRGNEVVGIVSRANLLQGLASAPAQTPPATAGARGDRSLRTRIDDEMRRAGLDTSFVNVVVADGVAWLWGAVRSEGQLDAARIAAERVMGDAKAVQNRLSVFPASVQRVMWAE